MLLLLCLWTQPLVGDINSEMPVYVQWDERNLDDPDGAVEAARQNFSTLNSERDTDAWLQVLLFLARNDWNGPWIGKDRDEILIKAQKIAEEKHYSNIAIMLEQGRMEDLVLKKKNYAFVRENYLAYIDKAKEQNAALAQAWLASSLAYAEYEHGDLASALKYGKQALEVILRVRSAEDADTLSIKNTIAVILESLGNKTQTIVVYEDLEPYLRQRNFRFSLAIVLCNHAQLLVHQKQDPIKAEKLYREALDIADKLRHSYLQTLAHKGLADVLVQQKQLPQSLVQIDLALDSSKKWPYYDHLRASLFIAKGKLLVEMGKWQEALDTATLSDNPITAKDKNTLLTIRHVMARAHGGLQHYQKAYEAQKEAFEILEAIHTEEKDAEYNKLHVQLGLELQEQKSLALKSENDLQRQRIEQDLWLRRGAILIIGLAVSVIILLAFALRKAGEVKRSRERMQNVLNNIEEGILTIGKGMQVESSLSPYLNTLLQLDPKVKSNDVFSHFMEAIDLDADEKSMLRSVLTTCLGETKSTWEFNLGQLPSELSLGGGKRWLGLHWQALMNEQGLVQSILMAVRDVTETRHLEHERDKARQNMADAERQLQEILLIDSREARSFVREFTSTLLLLDQSLLQQQRLMECFRALHTCKGLSRTLGMKELSLIVHEIEDGIDPVHSKLRDREAVARGLQKLKVKFFEYETWVKRLYPDGSVERLAPPSNLHEQLGRLLPILRQQLQDGGVRMASFTIQDEVLAWQPDILEKLEMILMHGLTNSVDHGFLLPQKRGKVLPDAPRFTVEAFEQASHYVIRLRDNGVGLDAKKLQSLALSRGFQPKVDQDWSDVLFQDGVSTAEQVSGTSGRGVGLSAIRQICESLRGKVRIRANDQGLGTCLEIQVPVHLHQSVA